MKQPSKRLRRLSDDVERDVLAQFDAEPRLSELRTATLPSDADVNRALKRRMRGLAAKDQAAIRRIIESRYAERS